VGRVPDEASLSAIASKLAQIAGGVLGRVEPIMNHAFGGGT
jgi:hypothetical protein